MSCQNQSNVTGLSSFNGHNEEGENKESLTEEDEGVAEQEAAKQE